MTKQLITISDNAAKRIKEILSNAETGVKGVRVSVKSGGCAGMEYEMTYLKETIPNDEVVVKIVWDPPWDKSKMSEVAKLALNI